MPSMQEALAKAGAVSMKQIREAEAIQILQIDLEENRRNVAAKEQEKRIGILHRSTDPAEFRREARKLLLTNPDYRLIQQIVQIAHDRGMHKKKDKGGTRLIAHLLQARAFIENLTVGNEAKQTFIKNNFPNK